MKSHLDQLMDENGIDACVISGKGTHNPSMAYMTKGAFINEGIIVKKREKDAILFHAAMERDSVLETGLKLQIAQDTIPNYWEITKSESDGALRSAKLLKSLLNHLGVEGTVAFFGTAEKGTAYRMLSFLKKEAQVEIYQGSVDIILLSRQTKDSEEIARINHVAKETGKILSTVRSFLGSLHEEDGYAVRPKGNRVSLGKIRELIRLELFKCGLLEDHPTIFSMGRDAGVPHNRGNDNDFLQTGNAIIMDIFPNEPNSYFFDCTRTFCLGYAPSEVESLYTDVLETQEAVLEEINAGVPHGQLLAKACEHFEQRNHPTFRTAPGTTNGFCHGLGHGIGLEIHEEPFFSLSKLKDHQSVIRIGEVFTIEPGLYYPEREMGVRLEDVVAITEEGMKNLSPFPKDLVIPLKG